MLGTVVLEKMLENPLDCKEITPVNPKGGQLEIFIGRAIAEAWILWPADEMRQLAGKDSDAEEDWRQEETGMTEDEMVWWHHLLNGHEFEQAPQNGEGWGGLVCWSPWGHKESDMTEQLNNKQWKNSVPASWKGNPSNRIWLCICQEGLTPGLVHYCLILKFLIFFFSKGISILISPQALQVM